MKKTDWEKLPVSMDLSERLPSGDQLSSAGSTLIVEDSNGKAVPEMVLDIAVSPVAVYGTIGGGIVGCSYTLRFKGLTNLGNQIEGRSTLEII